MIFTDWGTDMKNFKKISAAMLSLAVVAGLIPNIAPVPEVKAAADVKNYVYMDFNDPVSDAGVTYTTTNRTKDTVSQKISLGTDENGDNIDWLDFDGTMVISYDQLMKKSGDTTFKGNGVNAWLRHYWTENGVTKNSNFHHYLAYLRSDDVFAWDSGGKVIDGNPSSPSANLGTGNAIISWTGVLDPLSSHYTDFSERRWATVTIVAERDDDGSKFGLGPDVTHYTSYLDGKQIKSAYGKGDVYSRPDKCLIGGNPSYEYRVANAPDDVTIEYGYPAIYFVWNNDQNIMFDNYKIRVYGDTELQKAVAVEAGDTTVEIPVINNAITDASAPDAARAGYIMDLGDSIANSVITVKAYKYSADDVFMEKGTDVSKQVKLKSQNPNSETIAAPAMVAGKAILPFNGDTIFADIPTLAEGERLSIEVTGVKDIQGKDLASNKTVIVAGKGVGGVTTQDYFDNDLKLADGKLDTDVHTISVAYPDTTALALVDSDGDTVATADVNRSINHTFTLGRCLYANEDYDIVNGNGDVLFSFTTKGDVESFGEVSTNEFGALTVPYANTYEQNRKATLIASAFEVDTQVDIVSASETLAARSFGELTVERELASASTQDAFILGGNDLTTEPVSDSNIIRASVFSDTHKATVSGALPDGVYPVVAYGSDGAVKYARRVESKDGAYTFNLDLDGFDTDTYKLVIYTDNGPVSTLVAHSQNWSSDALRGASKSDIETLFGNVSAMSELEFAYPLFSELSPSAQKEAAGYLADSVRTIDLDNKADTVAAFRMAAIMAALNSDEAALAEGYMSDVAVLNDSNVAKWYYDTTAVVDSSRTEAWQQGVFDRLADYAQDNDGFDDIDDFQDKFVEALVYEAVSNHGATPILLELMDDLEKDYIKAGDKATETTITRLSEDEKNYKNLDGYKTLIDDLGDYITGSKKPQGGGGGGGGGAVTVPKPDTSVDIPAVHMPESTVAPTESTELKPLNKSSFNDMDDHNWAIPYVEDLYEKKIIDGVGDKMFAPAENVTREAFVKLIVEALSVPAPEADELPFEDVLADSWFRSYVLNAYGAGIINGISDTMFGSGNSVTRQDMAVIIYNAMGIEDDGNEPDTSVFADGADIADYAQKAVCKLAELKILNGYDDNTFLPNGNATRAEAAKVIYMVLENLNK